MREEIIGNARLILGDCLEAMPDIESVDHVIGDPPYEQLMQDLHASVKLRRTDGGAERKDLDFAGIDKIRPQFVREVKRLNRGWLIAFCNVEGVWHWRSALMDAGLKFKTTCIWHKPDATPKLNGQGPALAYECITTTWCGAGHARWNGGGRRGVFTHPTNNADRTGLHPTEKPVRLMRELVHLFSNAGQTVLDPFMGSGTTGVACMRENRKFIGIELNPTYFDIACRRIEDCPAPRLAVRGRGMTAARARAEQWGEGRLRAFRQPDIPPAPVIGSGPAAPAVFPMPGHRTVAEVWAAGKWSQ